MSYIEPYNVHLYLQPVWFTLVYLAFRGELPEMPPEEEVPEPIYNDRAYYDGKDYPRCTDVPSQEQRQRATMIPEHVEGQWICALPDDHENWDNPNVQNHSWVRVGA